MLKLIKPLPVPAKGDRIEVHSNVYGPRGTTRVGHITVEAGDTAADIAHYVDHMTPLWLMANPGTVRFVPADGSPAFDAFNWN
jgi:hypothetical protein